MAKPTTRIELKEYCLRRLGKPLIEINVADVQLEDRIDDSLSFFYDYHYDGSEHTYLGIEITQQMITERAIPVDDSIIGISKVFKHTSGDVKNIFDVKYQMRLNDAFWITAGNFQHYFMTMQKLAEAEHLFSKNIPIRFQRHMNRINLDTDWSNYAVGDVVIFEGYRIIDPETYADVYSDRFVRDYTTSLIKRQWGENLSKFGGMTLPGGMTLDGSTILSDAKEEIQKLEEDLYNSSAGLILDIIG